MAQGLTNNELVEYLGLPEDIITRLQTEQGTTWTATANEFLEALYNKIVYQSVDSMSFENPFKKYDGFPVNFGDTIENIFVEMPKGYKFNKDATDPFAKAKPSVKSLYASINYELQYETTVEDALLRRATLTEYGFMGIIDAILGQLQQAMKLDEYFATICMLNNADIYANGFEDVNVLETASDADIAETVTKTLVDARGKMILPATTQNKMGVMTVTPESRLLLVIKQDLLNKINLDYLAGVYNLEKVELLKNIIPVTSFVTKNDEDEDVGTDIDFIVVDTKGFDNHVALQDGGMIYNPKGKYTNHFYNLWKIISFKYFYNARAFKLNKTSA